MLFLTHKTCVAADEDTSLLCNATSTQCEVAVQDLPSKYWHALSDAVVCRI